MDNNIEAFKAKINECKIKLGNKDFQYVSQNSDTKIELKYSNFIKKIIFKGEVVENEIIAEINNAILETKKNFEKDWIEVINSFGIKDGYNSVEK